MADGKENCDTCGPGDLKVERVNGRNRVMVPDNFMADKLGSPDQQVVEAMQAARMLESQGVRIGETNDLSRIQPAPADDQPSIRFPQPEAPEIPRDFQTPGYLDEPPVELPQPPRHETPPIDIPGQEPTPTPIITPEPRHLIHPANFTIAETDAAPLAPVQYQRRPEPERERRRRPCVCRGVELDTSFGIANQGWQWQRNEHAALQDTRGNKNRGGERRSIDVAGQNYPSLTPHVYFSARVVLQVENEDPTKDVATAIVRCRVWPQVISSFGTKRQGVLDEVISAWGYETWERNEGIQEALKEWVRRHCPADSVEVCQPGSAEPKAYREAFVAARDASRGRTARQDDEGKQNGEEEDEEKSEDGEEAELSEEDVKAIIDAWSTSRPRGDLRDFVFFETTQKLKCTNEPQRITVRIPLLPISLDDSQKPAPAVPAYDHAKYFPELIIVGCGRKGTESTTLIDTTGGGMSASTN
jgi:hypothetical protein